MPLTLPEVLTGWTIVIAVFATLHQCWVRYIRPPMPGDDPIPWYGWPGAWIFVSAFLTLMFVLHECGFGG